MIAPQICYISHYRVLTNLLRQCFAKLPKRPEIIEATLGTDEPPGYHPLEGGFEVFVTTLYNARYLKSRANAPIVVIVTSPFDTVCALKTAVAEHAPPIALFQFLYHNPLLSSFKEIVGCDIKEYVFQDKDDGRAKLLQAKKEGVQTILCGGLIYNMAQELGCDRVLLVPKKEAILYSYERAEEIILARHNERRKSATFRCVVEHSFEGIIAINNEKRITVFNPAAEKILGISALEAMGRLVHEVLPEDLLPPVVDNGDAQLDQVKVFSQKKLIINAVPIYERREVVEAIFTLQEANRFIEEKVRRTAHSTDFAARMTFQDIVAASSPMRQTISHARLFGHSNETVLITGETGTGKEIFAQSIHNESARGTHPFVGVNCAAIPPTLLESELFGYAEGSFTGAKRGGSKGLFELAHGGTIFLDEIGEMQQDAQVRLLRVLQEKQVRRVGDTKVTPIDVRVIAATNQQLEQAVQNGLFRSDLYYRLNILQLTIPPLRERTDDILPLTHAFLYQFCADPKLRLIIQSIINKHHDFMLGHSWPGNVRELQNIVKRLVALSEAGTPDSIMEVIETVFEQVFDGHKTKREVVQQVPPVSLKDNLGKTEAELIARLYEKVDFNKSELAKALGIGRTTLWRKLNKLGLNAVLFFLSVHMAETVPLL